MEKSQESPSTTTSPSGWKIKIRSHSNSSISSQPPLPMTPLIESDNAFDRRLDLWAQTTTFQNIASHICHDVEKDMLRRQQQPPSTKQQQGDSSHTSSSANSPLTNGNPITQQQQQQREPEHRRNTMGDMVSFVFENPSILTDREYISWVQNGKEVHHPHQWLKLASLFHIHPKTAHQRSLITPATFQAAKIDRQVNTEVNRKQLENYLDLRRTQNRNYAENAVAEGAKLYDNKNVKEALDFYKRALDMDPQYAEGWYRVAESLLQQKRTNDAIAQLQKALRIEPTHENAKALLCTLENTTSYTNKNQVLKEDTMPLVTGKRDEKDTTYKELDRRHHSRDDEDDEKDRQRRKKRREDSDHRRQQESKRRSRNSVSPSSSTRKRSRRSVSPPDRKSKRSHRPPPPHYSKRSHRHSSLSPLPDDTLSRSKRRREDRDRHRERSDRPSSPHRDKSKSSTHDKEKDDSSRYHTSRHHSSRSKEKSPKRRHHRHHHKERSSKKIL